MESVPYLDQSQHTSPEFFEKNRFEVEQVFKTLNIHDQWDGTLTGAVDLTQPWVKGDHGEGSYDFGLTDEQKSQLATVYDKLDLKKRRDLPAGHYDQILVLGAVHLGNDKRLRFLHESMTSGGVSADQIVLMGGQRTIFEKREPEDVVVNLESLEAKSQTSDWLEHFLQKPLNEVDETDMLRVSALDHLGPLALRALHLHVGVDHVQNNKSPQHRMDFDWEGTPLALTHTRAVPRKDGNPRHTTEACIQDWVRTFSPSDGSRVAFIGSQPHPDRMVKASSRNLKALGRNIELVPGGPGTTPATGHTIYLGEIARNLYEDLQARG